MTTIEKAEIATKFMKQIDELKRNVSFMQGQISCLRGEICSQTENEFFINGYGAEVDRANKKDSESDLDMCF